MGVNYRKSITTLATNQPTIYVDVWVAYDEGYGGFFVAAKAIEVKNDIRYAYLRGDYRNAFILEGFKRGSQKRLDQAVAIATEQIAKKDGASWEVVSRLCRGCELVIEESVAA